MSPICLRRSGHYRAMCELRTSRPLQFQLKHRSLAELVVLRDRHANGREDLTNIEKKHHVSRILSTARPVPRSAGPSTHTLGGPNHPRNSIALSAANLSSIFMTYRFRPMVHWLRLYRRHLPIVGKTPRDRASGVYILGVSETTTSCTLHRNRSVIAIVCVTSLKSTKHQE